MTAAALLGVLTTGGLLAGCPVHHDVEAAPSFVEVAIHSASDVDLLVVMDNTGSMHEEQTVFGNGVEGLLVELLTPSPDRTGRLPRAARSLHVGVVSTDMGTGGITIMTCRDPVDGDGGELRAAGRYDGCQETYDAPDCSRPDGCPWLAHTPEAPDDGSVPSFDPPIWQDLQCIATLGTGGCGFEQPLEAAWTALVEQTGQGDSNEGFLRTDTVLAVLFLTDEDDCSAADPTSLFDPTRDDLGPLNVRCVLQEQHLLYSTDRYVDGLRALRPGREELVLAATITGVPPELPVYSDWLAWAEEVRAGERVNPMQPNELLPSCETTMGWAFPPPRIAEVAARLGGPVRSICQTDFTQHFEDIARAIQARLSAACAAAPVSDGCRLVASLPDDRPCPWPAEPERADGHLRDLGLDESGRRQCEVLSADEDGDGCPDGGCPCEGCPLGETDCARAPDGCLDGWFLDRSAFGCPNGQVRLTRADLVPTSSHLRLECSAAACPAPRRAAAAFASLEPCDPEAEGGDCGSDSRCVRASGEACRGAASCGRCVPTVATLCPGGLEAPGGRLDEPILDPGGCCLAGLLADGDGCAPAEGSPCLGASCACLDDETCDDGLACNGVERCEGCACLPGEPPLCDDGDPCTLDRCEEPWGCVFFPRDRDGDGAGDGACGGTDCDDEAPDVRPGEFESCDGRDEDCDGLVDEPAPTSLGRGVPAALVAAGSEAALLRHVIEGAAPRAVVSFVEPGGRASRLDVDLGSGAVDAAFMSAAWSGAVVGVAWLRDMVSGPNLFFSAADPSTGAARSLTRLNDEAGLASGAAIAWSGSSFAVAWADERDAPGMSAIYLTRVTPEGEELGEEVPVTDVDRMHQEPSLAWSGDGIGLAWVGPGDPLFEVFFLPLDSEGVPLGEPTQLSEGGGGNPQLLWTGTSWLVAWSESGLGWALQRLDPTGTPVGDVVRSPAELRGLQDLSVAWTGAETVVAWSGGADYQLFLARLDPTGAWLEGPLESTTTADGVVNAPQVAALPSGLALAWRALSSSTVSMAWPCD